MILARLASNGLFPDDQDDFPVGIRDRARHARQPLTKRETHGL